jgi:hypothetical protein
MSQNSVIFEIPTLGDEPPGTFVSSLWSSLTWNWWDTFSSRQTPLHWCCFSSHRVAIVTREFN